MSIQLEAPIPILVHFIATRAAGRHHRMVLVLSDGSDHFQLWPVCSHTSNCDWCRKQLAQHAYVNLGTIHVGSEVEMEGIGFGEPPTPAAAEGLPK